MNDTIKPFLEDLPVFPLPQMVFLPHTTLPLHIFEPRYRQMIRDVRENGSPIAMAMLLPDAEPDEFDRPAMSQIVGLGNVENVDMLPDGRFLIELKGLARVQIIREHDPSRLYRTVRSSVLPDEPYSTVDAQKLLENLEILILGLRHLNPHVSEYLAELVGRYDDPAAISDVVASVLFPEPDNRQALLQELDPLKRLDSVVTRLSEVLAMATPSHSIH